MFGYAPTTRDESGMIRGQGITNSAQIMGEAKVGLVDDIGSALVGLAASYGAKKGTEAKGKNFKKFMGMAGETFGIDGSLFNDMEDYDAGMMLEDFGSWLPAMANAQLGRSRLGVQQNLPYFNAGIKNATNIAGQGGPGMQRGGLPPAGAIFQ
jgi:hypothetical protein